MIFQFLLPRSDLISWGFSSPLSPKHPLYESHYQSKKYMAHYSLSGLVRRVCGDTDEGNPPSESRRCLGRKSSDDCFVQVIDGLR